MESLRRLRIVWACFCALNAAYFAVIGMGICALAAIIGMVAFFVQGSAGVKLTVLWFGYVGLIIYGVMAPRDPQGTYVMLGLMAAAWAVAAIFVWVLKGIIRPKRTSPL